MACVCGRHIRDLWVGGEEGGELTDPPETGDTSLGGCLRDDVCDRSTATPPFSSTASDGRH